MKNSQKGFVVPVLIAIIALLVIGGGVYIYKNKKAEVPAIVDNGTQPTNTQTPSVVTNQTILNSLITDWKKIGPSILPGFPAVSQAFYGYPDIIQFIGNNRIIISYQDDFNPLFAVLNYDTKQKQFSYLDGLRSSPFKVSETLWNTWRNKYGDTSFAPQAYQFSSTRTGDVVYSSDWKLVTKNPFVSTTQTQTPANTTASAKISNVFPSGSIYTQGEGASITLSWNLVNAPAGTTVYLDLLTPDGSESLGRITNNPDCSRGGDTIALATSVKSYKWDGLYVCQNWQAHSVNPGSYKIGASLYSANGATIIASGQSNTSFSLQK